MVMREWSRMEVSCVVSASSSSVQAAILMILTVAGEDAEAEFESLHPPYVVEKYASDAIVGVVNKVKTNQAEGPVKSGLPVASVRCDVVSILEAGGDRRIVALDNTPAVLLVEVRAFSASSFEDCAMISSAKKVKISNHRAGGTRSAAFVIFSHCGTSRGRSVRVQGNGRSQRLWLLRCSFVLDRLSTLYEHSQGICIDECVVASHRFEHHWFDVAQAHDRAPFQFCFADIKHYFFGSPPPLIEWWPCWLITLTFFMFQRCPSETTSRMSSGFYFMAVVIFMASVSLGRGRGSRCQLLAVAGMWGLPQPPTVAFSRDSSTFVRACCGLLGSPGQWWKGETLIVDTVDVIARVEGLLELTQSSSS